VATGLEAGVELAAETLAHEELTRHSSAVIDDPLRCVDAHEE
jgi:hypothetical protein